MAANVWLFKDSDFAPGADLFRSERQFQLWSYSATHSQLLLRAERMPEGDRLPTTVEVLFKPVEAMQVEAAYNGLVIRCATEEERHGSTRASPTTGTTRLTPGCSCWRARERPDTS